MRRMRAGRLFRLLMSDCSILTPSPLFPLPLPLAPSPLHHLELPEERILLQKPDYIFSVDEFVSVFCQSSFLMNFQPYTILKYSNLFFLFYNGDSLTTRCPVIPKDLPYLFARNRPFWSYVFLRSQQYQGCQTLSFVLLCKRAVNLEEEQSITFYNQCQITRILHFGFGKSNEKIKRSNVGERLNSIC